MDIQQFREKFPESKEFTDREITEGLHKRYVNETGDAELSLQDFGNEFGVSFNDPGRLQTAGTQALKGVVGVASNFMRGDAVSREKFNRNISTMFDEVDALGQSKSFTASPYKRIEKMYSSASPEAKMKMREHYNPRDPREHNTYQIGEAMDAEANTYPSNPEYEQEFIAGKLPHALGSMGAFAAATIATGPFGGGVLGAESLAGAEFEQALSMGATEEEAIEAADMSRVIGVTEVFPIMSAFRKTDKATGGRIKTAIKKAVEVGTEEAIQESASQVLQNLAAQGIYDPERDTFQGAGEGAQVGGASGAILGFITGLGQKRSVKQPEQPVPEETGVEQPLNDVVAAEALAPEQMQESEIVESVAEPEVDVVADNELINDLPMDSKSRESRAKEMGFDTGEVWYHGSTHDIKNFGEGNYEKGSHFGGADYFTNSTNDASKNYAGEGPDLTQRITMRAEQIASENDWDYDDARAKDMAKKELKGGSDGAIYPSVVRVDNTFNADSGNDYLSYSESELNREDYDSDEDFEQDSFDEERTGPLFDFIESIQEQAQEHGFDANPVVDAIIEESYEGEISHERINEIMRSTEWYAEDNQNGDMINNDVFKNALEAAGYDSIRMDATVPGWNMDIDPGTEHLIVLDPSKIRSVNAKFDTKKKESTDILAQRDGPVKSEESVKAWAPGINHMPKVDFGESRESTAKISVGDRIRKATKIKPKMKPIQRQEVVRKYAKALGIPVFEGKPNKSKGALGYYFPGTESMRVQKEGNFETTAHEIAHMLDDRLWNSFGKRGKKSTTPYKNGNHPKSEIFREELLTVSYDQNLDYEGFAEFVRLWMTQPEAAKKGAPNFYEYWEGYLNENKKLGKIIREAKQDMLDYINQDSLTRSRSKMGDTPSSSDGIITGKKDQIRQGVFDDMHGFFLLDQDTSGKPQSGGLYEAARLSKSSKSVVDGALRYGVPTLVNRDGKKLTQFDVINEDKLIGDFDVKFVGKGLQEIFDPVGKDFDDFISYATGRSAKELWGQGREKLFTEDEINAMVELGENNKLFQDAFDGYQEWNNGILDYAQALGYINAKQRKTWRRNEYIPFYRVNNIKGGGGKKGGVEGLGSATHMLTGGSGNLKDIMGNIIQNASHMITEATHNHVRMKAAMASKEIGGGKWMEPVPPSSKMIPITRNQVIDEFLSSLGIPKKMYTAYKRGDIIASGIDPESRLGIVLDSIQVAEGNMEEFIQMWQINQSPNADNIVAVMINGKPKYFQVSDDILYRSFQALNPRHRDVFIKSANAVRRLGQQGITMTPDFLIANIFRDTWHGFVFSKHGFIPMYDSIRGMISRIREDGDYKDYIANGGGMSSYLVNEDTFKFSVDKFMTSQGISTKYVVNTPARWYHFLENAGDAFEMSTRLGEYKRGRAKGVSRKSAAFAGREVSTDFAMRGDNVYANGAFDTILFLKAGMNGLDRAYRGLFKDDNRGTIWMKTGMVASASVWLMLLAMSDEESREKYEGLQDWDRDGNWHVFMRDTEGKMQHYRFPKIWEIGAIASIAERTVHEWVYKDKEFGTEYLDITTKILMDNFKLEYLPQVIAPATELAINKNRFTGNPVVPESEKDRSPQYQYGPSTSATAKALGETLGMSPRQIQHLVRGYFTTWGMYGLQLSDEAFFNENQPAKELNDYPVFRRFMAPEVPRGTKEEQEYWKIFEEYKNVTNDINFLKKQNRPAELDKVITENVELLGQGKAINGTRKTISELYAAMERVRTDIDLTPQQKTEKRKALRADINKIYQEITKGLDNEE